MDYINPLEEPPPINRAVVPAEPPRKPGLFAGWAARSSAPRRSSEPAPAAHTGSRKGVVLVLAGVAVLSVQGWMIHGLRTDLEEARGSVGSLWESTKRLDEDKVARLAQLADSIRWVFDYAQGGVRLWEAAYATLEQRVDGNIRGTAKNDTAISRMSIAMRVVNTRLDGFARADQVQRSQLSALERQDRTHSYAVEALSRRTQTQEATVLDVSATVASLRGTLRDLDSNLALLDQRLSASSSAYGQLGRRIESLSGWADGFRRAGLSADAVNGQLASLTDQVRRIRMRVDSLRPGRSVTSSDR